MLPDLWNKGRQGESCNHLNIQEYSNMSEMMILCCCRGLEDMLGGACYKFGYMDACGVLHVLLKCILGCILEEWKIAIFQ